MEAYDKRIAVKTVLLSQLLIESLDDLKDTTLYTQSVKNLINKLDKQLAPMVKEHYDKMYSEDVQEGIDVFDLVIDRLVHEAVIDVRDKEYTNLYVLRDSKTGKVVKIKSQLSIEEFEEEYGVKLGDVNTLK